MKYGKKYQETLQAPGIPEEWRQQAIEYRQLKKVINRVATELKELGLTSEVLKELLSQQAPPPSKNGNGVDTNGNLNGYTSPSSSSKRKSNSTLRSTSSNHVQVEAAQQSTGSRSDATFAASEDDKLEAVARIEAVAAEDDGVRWTTTSSEDSSVDEKVTARSSRSRSRRPSKMRRARASYELAGTSANPEPRIRIVFSSASSDSISESSSGEGSGGSQAKNGAHVRPSSESNQRFTELRESSEEEEEEEEDDDESSPSHSRDGSHSHHVRHPLGNHTHQHRHDRKRSTSRGDESTTNDESNSSSSVRRTRNIEFEGAGPQANALLKKMYGLEESDVDLDLEQANLDGDEEDHDSVSQKWANVELEVEPKRRRSDETLRRVDTTSGSAPYTDVCTPTVMKHAGYFPTEIAEESPTSAQASDADDEDEKPTRRRRRHIHRQARKEVFIPLNKDNEFLGLLAKALASLAALQLAQKQNFTQAVELLAREVSQVSAPNRPKSDMYIWREIFSLWVEAQIFESTREKDRGERDVDAVQEKLGWFVDQVAKRKLAKRMKHKESRHALDRFIQLNVELLDMKKFQLANEEAARKILKKHDKRTALTASLGFPKFIAAASSLSASDSPDNPNSRILTLPGFVSLPHVLLSTFTTVLLPIIPQLEDYECAICGEVAFKPIKLECGHKFCVRCLVKMQKRGQDACPQCRSPVVLRANATNLDTAMQSYLQLWFPKEVKAKSKSNSREAAKEELEEMGMVDHRCIVM